MDEDSGNSRIAWSAYWKSGKTASCYRHSGTEVHFDSIWNALVDSLKPGSRILDLATGNGTIARYCADRANAKNLRIHIDAIDAAQIAPPEHKDTYATTPSATIEYHSGVHIESLPFPDKSFDAVISQFGFEYARMKPAVAEVCRVLADGGVLQLVVHLKAGAAWSDIYHRANRLQSVTNEAGIATILVKLIQAWRLDSNLAVQQNLDSLGAIKLQLQTLQKNSPPDDSANYYSAALLYLWENRNRFEPSDLVASAERALATAQNILTRYQDMLRAAYSEADTRALSGMFNIHGLNAPPARTIKDATTGKPIAWSVSNTEIDN